MPSPTFLRVEQDHQAKLWCISLIAVPNPGYAFLVVCKSKAEADTVVLKISNDVLNYPTVDPTGYSEITSRYPHLQKLVRVFEPV